MISRLIKNSFLIKTFKDHKNGDNDINKKNNMVEVDRKDMEDSERNIEDFAIDTKFIIDFYTNIVNFGEANKSIGDIISIFLKKVKKRFNGTDKSIGDIIFAFFKKVRKKVNDIDKVAKNTTSNYLEKVKKRVDDIIKNARDTIFPFFRKVRKKINNDALTHI